MRRSSRTAVFVDAKRRADKKIRRLLMSAKATMPMSQQWHRISDPFRNSAEMRDPKVVPIFRRGILKTAQSEMRETKEATPAKAPCPRRGGGMISRILLPVALLAR